MSSDEGVDLVGCHTFFLSQIRGVCLPPPSRTKLTYLFHPLSPTSLSLPHPLSHLPITLSLFLAYLSLSQPLPLGIKLRGQ